MENKADIKKNLSKTIKYVENYLFVNGGDYFELEKIFVDDLEILDDGLHMVAITVDLKCDSDDTFDDVIKNLELVKTKLNSLFYKIFIDFTGKISKERTNHTLSVPMVPLLLKMNFDYYEQEIKLRVSYFFE